MFDMLMGKKEGGLMSVTASAPVEEQPASLKEMAGKMALTAMAANDACGFAKAICLIVKASEIDEGEEY